MIKVLEVVGRMDRAGQETFLMNIFRTMDSSEYDMTFSVNTNHIGDYEDEIVKKNGKVFHNPYAANFKNMCSYLREFRQYIKENGPFDVVHCHVYYFSAFLLWAAYKEGVPVRIMHSHNTSDGYNDSVYRKIYRSFTKRLINKYATQKVACGKDAYKALFEVDCPDDLYILNNAINIQYFNENKLDVEAIKKKNEINDEKIFISVARFCDVKNHRKIISVFDSYIKNIDSNAILLLIGVGELQQDIMNMVDSLGIRAKVRFLGNRDDVNELLLISDLFIMPSKFEGLPVSLIEAQAAGVQCVISDTITDEVDMDLDEITKINLEESDLVWADACKIALDKSKKSFSERQNGLYIKGYTTESVWRKIDAIYKSGN